MDRLISAILTDIEMHFQHLECIGADRFMPKEAWASIVDRYWSRRNAFEALETPRLRLTA